MGVAGLEKEFPVTVVELVTLGLLTIAGIGGDGS
jgi:L-cystine uptake protein TcyP (sodium:dicarboxylate symporter family)